MVDPHQVNAIIATAATDFFRECPEIDIGAEATKLLAKKILEALNDAGLKISLNSGQAD